MDALFDKEFETRRRFQKVDFWKPYRPQLEHMIKGAAYRERLFMAGNQTGKSDCGAYETSLHLTGEYPAWWTGKRFNHPVRCMAIAETGLQTRDVLQKKLCGTPGVIADFGTGFIPKANFVDTPSLSRGVTDAYDMIQVQHRTNGVPDGISILIFRSYEQGRSRFQGDTINFAWMDEECPMEIYSEVLARLTGTGMALTTFTPLLGETALVRRFTSEGRSDCTITMMTLDDALHFTAEEKAKRLAGYPEHERETRRAGLPMRGAGLVYQVAEKDIVHDRTIESFNGDPAIRVGWGIDVTHGGTSVSASAFGACLGFLDTNSDVLYIMDCIKLYRQLLPAQAAAIRAHRFGDCVVLWPKDARQVGDSMTGQTFADQLKKLGLRTAGTWVKNSHGVAPSLEDGIAEVTTRMTTGRLKIARHLIPLWDEMRSYHRKDRKVVAEDCDVLDALRILVCGAKQLRTIFQDGPQPGRPWSAADWAIHNDRTRRNTGTYKGGPGDDDWVLE